MAGGASKSMSNTNKPPEPLSRAATILEAVASVEPNGLEVAKIAQNAGLPLATAHRLVQSLVAVGYLEGGRRGGYRLGARLYGLLERGVTRDELSSICRPLLQRAANELNLVVFLSRTSGRRIVTAVQAIPEKISGSLVLLGSDAPFHATASGKLFLAGMAPDKREDFFGTCYLEQYRPSTITDPNELRREIDRVRAAGYATCRDEFDENVYSLACPVELAGNPLAFVAGVIGFEPDLLAEDGEPRILGHVRKIAADLSAIVSALFKSG